MNLDIFPYMALREGFKKVFAKVWSVTIELKPNPYCKIYFFRYFFVHNFKFIAKNCYKILFHT